MTTPTEQGAACFPLLPVDDMENWPQSGRWTTSIVLKLLEEYAIANVMADRLARASLPSSEGAGWIGVDERLPAKDEPVLVFAPTGVMPITIDEWCDYHEAPVSWSSATIVTGEGWSQHDFEQITHWMPLPSAPGAAPVVEPASREVWSYTNQATGAKVLRYGRWVDADPNLWAEDGPVVVEPGAQAGREAGDDVLQALDLPADQFRTDSGAINRGKLRAAILHPADYLPAEHWLNAPALRAKEVALKSAMARANRMGVSSTDAICIITEYEAASDAARATQGDRNGS